MHRPLLTGIVGCVALLSAGAAPPASDGPVLTPGARVWMHAHNCYPDKGAWQDRLTRALATGLPWIAIEQDLAWDPTTVPGDGRSVVAHDTPLIGGEPTLEAHFFDRVVPLLDRALAEGARDRWPLLVLHLEFKTNEPEHHRAVWSLLGRYERYLTTASHEREGRPPSPLRLGPLLVLAESGEEVFRADVPLGGSLRVFGAAPTPDLSDADRQRRHVLPPDALIPHGATSYRRWVNLPWDAVESGGPDEAAEWTQADAARLRALVERAHAGGLWIRFYTLNGHAADAGLGWSPSYNFGSLGAARTRWRAAMDAGVDFVATDQYEAFAREWRRTRRR